MSPRASARIVCAVRPSAGQTPSAPKRLAGSASHAPRTRTSSVASEASIGAAPSSDDVREACGGLDVAAVHRPDRGVPLEAHRRRTPCAKPRIPVHPPCQSGRFVDTDESRRIVEASQRRPVQRQNALDDQVAAGFHRPSGPRAPMRAEIVGWPLDGAAGAKLQEVRLKQSRVDSLRRVVVDRFELLGGCVRTIPIVGIERQHGGVGRAQGGGSASGERRLAGAGGAGDRDEIGQHGAAMQRRASLVGGRAEPSV